MLIAWMVMACGGSDSGPSEAPPPEPVAPPPPPVSIEARLEACLEKESDRGSEGGLACAKDAAGAWQVRLDEALSALTAAAPAVKDPLKTSQDAWTGLRTADAALGAALRAKHPPMSAWDVRFEQLTAIRDRATRVERYAAAARAEPEPPEFSEHPIDQELQNCLRKPEGRAGCAESAVAAWQVEAERRADALGGLLGDPAVVRQAQDAWTVYQRADEVLAQALLTDPVLVLRERASLARRRAELLGERVEQLRPSEQ